MELVDNVACVFEYDTQTSSNKLTHVQILAERSEAERAKVGTDYV